MANATLRYQEVGAQGLRPFRSSGERRKKKELSPLPPYSPTPPTPLPPYSPTPPTPLPPIQD